MKQQLQKSKFHFVGIGGIGMCGLAELLHNMGAKVSGSDMAENANTIHLKKIGVKVFLGHDSKNVGDVDVLVFSSAVKSDNPELQAARVRKIPIIPRAEALAEIMRLKRGVAVAGTHGKTTTTSMAASIFLEAKVNPTIVVGGRLNLIQSTALLGEGEWIIAEADESDGSFNKLSPEIAIITNIDADHLDFYKNFENLQKSFLQFAGKVPFYGSVIICGDDLKAKMLFDHFPKNIFFYGFDEANDYQIHGSDGKYSLSFEGREIGRFKLNVPGRHNALNAVAAIIAGLKAGFSFDVCAKGLLNFTGVDRRFQFKGEAHGVKVYDDYGHHPTEVAATLQAFREKYPTQRLVVLFQPHRYSRTQTCWKEFLQCFHDCDHVILTDIYSAGEKPIDKITSKILAEELNHPSHEYMQNKDLLPVDIANKLKDGDVFITLGAGDVWKIGARVLEQMHR